MATHCHSTPGLPGETLSKSKSEPLDLWFFDVMMVDLTQAGHVIEAALELLSGVDHIRADGARVVALDRAEAVLVAANALVEKMIGEFDKQHGAWRAVAGGVAT